MSMQNVNALARCLFEHKWLCNIYKLYMYSMNVYARICIMYICMYECRNVDIYVCVVNTNIQYVKLMQWTYVLYYVVSIHSIY